MERNHECKNGHGDVQSARPDDRQRADRGEADPRPGRLPAVRAPGAAESRFRRSDHRRARQAGRGRHRQTRVLANDVRESIMQAPVTPLGVGLPYLASLPADLYSRDLIDFVEITPETLCRQRQEGAAIVLDLIPDKFERARDVCGTLPIVVHGVELSIGSAHGWNAAYLAMLDRFQSRWPFEWHSEHLGFQTIPDADGTPIEIGVPLPLPPTLEAATIVAERSRAIGNRYRVPFALENPAHYLTNLPVDP